MAIFVKWANEPIAASVLFFPFFQVLKMRLGKEKKLSQPQGCTAGWP